jgi:alkylation response protein AidB-like acyl-CoA dehydrogenase
MDFDLPPDDDPRRLAVRAWLAEHPSPTQAEMAHAGYVAPHWPEPWGLGADAEHQLILDDEMARAGVPRLETSIGVGWAGPTILAGGTEEQQRRYLPGILDGRDVWCQLFSEPEAGSDLASLRTRAVRDGDEYVVDGQKIWTTWADASRYGILLARTGSEPGASKHEGISYFVLDMESPGVEVRRIIEMTGGNHFNEVFLTDVRIPATNVVGDVDGGWPAARTVLSNEASVIGGGNAAAVGLDALIKFAGATGTTTDPALRQRLARAFSDEQILGYMRGRVQAAVRAGRRPDIDPSVLKIRWAEARRDRAALGVAIAGASGMLLDTWPLQLLEYFSGTIGGGTSEVHRNMIGERALGLPPEPRVDKDVPYRDLASLRG